MAKRNYNWGGEGFPTYDGIARAQDPPQSPPPPDPNANPNDLTPQQLRDRAAGVGQPPPPPGTQPPAAPPPPEQQQPVPPAQPPGAPQQHQPVRQQDGSFALQLPTGQVYKGKTEQEVIQNVINAQIEASRTITDLNAERRRLQGIASAAIGGQPTDASGQPTGALQWDVDTYKRLVDQDPMMAQNYLDACRFGFDSLEAVQRELPRMYNNAIEYENAQTINRFRALAPDFPGTQEAVNKVMDTMAANNIAFTADNLAMVHRDMVAKKVYAPAQVPGQQQPQVQQQPAYPPQQQPGIPPQFMPQPVGNYAYEPGQGFGVAQPPQMFMQPAYPPQTPQTQAPAAPVPYYPPQQFVPAPQSSFPAQPLPTLQPMNPGFQPGAPALDENAINGMGSQQLRQMIEQFGLQR